MRQFTIDSFLEWQASASRFPHLYIPSSPPWHKLFCSSSDKLSHTTIIKVRKLVSSLYCSQHHVILPSTFLCTGIFWTGIIWRQQFSITLHPITTVNPTLNHCFQHCCIGWLPSTLHSITAFNFLYWFTAVNPSTTIIISSLSYSFITSLWLLSSAFCFTVLPLSHYYRYQVSALLLYNSPIIIVIFSMFYPLTPPLLL